jgi:hypothetical protein
MTRIARTGQTLILGLVAHGRLPTSLNLTVRYSDDSGGDVHFWRMRPLEGAILLSTEESMATPCSVKTYGAYFRCLPRPVFKAPNWLLKESDFLGRELEHEASWKTLGIAANCAS